MSKRYDIQEGRRSEPKGKLARTFCKVFAPVLLTPEYVRIYNIHAQKFRNNLDTLPFILIAWNYLEIKYLAPNLFYGARAILIYAAASLIDSFTNESAIERKVSFIALLGGAIVYNLLIEKLRKEYFSKSLAIYDAVQFVNKTS